MWTWELEGILSTPLPSVRLPMAGRLVWLRGGEGTEELWGVGLLVTGAGEGSRARLATLACRGTSLEAASMAAANCPLSGSL